MALNTVDAYMPMSNTGLRPNRSERAPPSQAASECVAEVPGINKLACQNGRCRSSTIGGRMKPMPVRLRPT